MDLFKMYFKRIPMKWYYVACEVAKRAYKHNIIENIFEDDGSENHEVIFTKAQWKDAALLWHCLKADRNGNTIAGFSIYDVDIRRVEGFCEYEGNLHLNGIKALNGKMFKESQYVAHFLGNQFKIDLVPNARNNAREVIEILKKRLVIKDESQLAKLLRDKYMVPMENEWRKCQKYIIGNYEDSRAQCNKIYDELILEGKVPLKWKSEFELFQFIKKYFDDAMYQYPPEWLFPQRYDIYVPSIKTAFEYQGIQHYKSVDFFGGEEGLKKRIELDNKKREKSIANGVKLIEWLHSEPMTTALLDKKLQKKGV
jgi:hypothetical protein